MFVLRSVIAKVISVLAVGFVGTYSAYEYTKETFLSQVKDDILPDHLNDSWRIKETQLLRVNNNDLQFGLREVKDEVSRFYNGLLLKRWCWDKYTETYKSWFQKADIDLLKEIKERCILSIKDQLEDGKHFDDVEEASAKDNLSVQLNKLNKNDSTLPLDSELLNIKNKESSNREAEQAKELLIWCKNTYKRGYKGSDDDLWVLAKALCEKN